MLHTKNVVFFAGAMVGVALFGSACLISPHDLQHIANRDTAITFQGCHVAANLRVTLEACGVSGCGGGRGAVLAETRTAASVSYTDSLGQSWYCFSQNVVVPRQHWTTLVPTGGYLSVVQAYMPDSGSGGQLSFFNNDPSQCPAAYGMPTVQSNDPKCLNKTGGKLRVIADR